MGDIARRAWKCMCCAAPPSIESLHPVSEADFLVLYAARQNERVNRDIDRAHSIDQLFGRSLIVSLLFRLVLWLFLFALLLILFVLLLLSSVRFRSAPPMEPPRSTRRPISASRAPMR